MGEIIKDYCLVIITEPNSIYFDLPKKLDNKLKHKVHFIAKHDKLLAEYVIKNEVSRS